MGAFVRQLVPQLHQSCRLEPHQPVNVTESDRVKRTSASDTGYYETTAASHVARSSADPALPEPILHAALAAQSLQALRNLRSTRGTMHSAVLAVFGRLVTLSSMSLLAWLAYQMVLVWRRGVVLARQFRSPPSRHMIYGAYTPPPSPLGPPRGHCPGHHCFAV